MLSSRGCVYIGGPSPNGAGTLPTMRLNSPRYSASGGYPVSGSQFSRNAASSSAPVFITEQLLGHCQHFGFLDAHVLEAEVDIALERLLERIVAWHGGLPVCAQDAFGAGNAAPRMRRTSSLVE
jgi:hypothetical protein